MSDDKLDLAGKAHDAIYRILRNRIMCGELPPNTALRIRAVAAEFGVSMTPAREALRHLAAEGALFASSSGRFSTPELSSERMEELATLRALIEVELASRALPRAHLALIERLHVINNKISVAVAKADSVAYIRANLEFHRTLYLRAQAPTMLAILETVWLQIGPTLSKRYASLRRHEPPRDHRLILSALHAGDDPGLRIAIRADVTKDLRRLSQKT